MHRPLLHMKLPGMLHSLVKLFPGSSWLSVRRREQVVRGTVTTAKGRSPGLLGKTGAQPRGDFHWLSLLVWACFLTHEMYLDLGRPHYKDAEELAEAMQRKHLVSSI